MTKIERVTDLIHEYDALIRERALREETVRLKIAAIDAEIERAWHGDDEPPRRTRYPRRYKHKPHAVLTPCVVTPVEEARRPVFNELCLPLYSELRAFACKLTGGDRARAEDVVQDAYMKAVPAWVNWVPDGEPAAAARAWMYRIVANTFTKTYHRGRVRGAAVEHHMVDMLIGTYGTATASRSAPWGEGAMSDEVADALASLTPDHRAVGTAFYFRELPCDKIALELGIPQNTVFTRLCRARLALGKSLAAYADAEYGLGGTGEDALVQAPEDLQTDAGDVDAVMVRRNAQPLRRTQPRADDRATG